MGWPDMPRERRPGEPLDNARHERFAQARAAGKSATGAYEEAGYEPDSGHASRLAGNGSVSERVTELLKEAERLAVDASKITKDMVLGGLLHEAMHAKSDGARVQAWKHLGQSNVVALFVGDDENRKPATPQECARAIAGDNDELYRMILTTVPLSPSEKQ